MPNPTTKITRIIRSEQVLKAFMQVVRKHPPLNLKNSHIRAEAIVYALGYANVHCLSTESVRQELKDAPSRNRFRNLPRQLIPFKKAFRLPL